MGDVSFRGTWTALVTPFAKGAETIDFDALGRLVEEQIAAGIAGLVPCGTTGEAPTLTDEEQLEVLRCVVRTARGRVPVMAGTGSNNTAKTIKASQAALGAGADAVMLVMPYYNKPSQDGLREHVLAVAAKVDCPVVLYNIPGRSVVDLGVPATVQICERAPNVLGMKDASGNVLRCQELVRALGDRLAILSGDDVLTLPMMACGVRGVISVTSNVLPAKVSAVTERALVGDWDAAKHAHYEISGLHGAMFVEPNPVPAKVALSWLGRMNPDVRLPLVGASETTRAKVVEELSKLGVRAGS
jgi:4-hydroxy-tetrahydrodipicolinate synthase